MSQQQTEVDLDMSNMSLQEEDAITRNRELFKVLLLHKFPGCTVIDYHNRPDCKEDEEFFITDFDVIFNILDTSKFEDYVEQAAQFIYNEGYANEHCKSNNNVDQGCTFALGPFIKKEKTITYCFGFLYKYKQTRCM